MDVLILNMKVEELKEKKIPTFYTCNSIYSSDTLKKVVEHK